MIRLRINSVYRWRAFSDCGCQQRIAGLNSLSHSRIFGKCEQSGTESSAMLCKVFSENAEISMANLLNPFIGGIRSLGAFLAASLPSS
jgi:hypothetical protein